jgi:CRISPR-associated protein Csb2
MMTPPRVARYTLRAARPVDVRLTLRFGELARRAAQAVYGRLFAGAASPALSGKQADGAPLAGHAHAFFLPTDEDGDGALDHLTLYCAAGFGPNEQQALEALDLVRADDENLHIALQRLPGAQPADFPDAALLATALRWRSATPFSLTRHYKTRGQKRDRFPPEQLPEANLREEAARRGLPSIAALARLETGALWHHAERRPMGGRALYWGEFHQRRAFGAGRHGEAMGVGFEITFAEPAAGPIALGYACHFGLGLFVPA